MPSTIGVAEAATRSLATFTRTHPVPYPRSTMHSTARYCPVQRRDHPSRVGDGGLPAQALAARGSRAEVAPIDRTSSGQVCVPAAWCGPELVASCGAAGRDADAGMCL